MASDEASGSKPAPVVHKDAPVLEVRGLSWTDRLRNISLSLHKGEIIGLGGLDGQGQRDLRGRRCAVRSTHSSSSASRSGVLSSHMTPGGPG